MEQLENTIPNILRKTDFDSPLLYKVYSYLVKLNLHNFPNIHTFFTNSQISLLFDKASECHPRIIEIYNLGEVLAGCYNNFMGMPIRYVQKSNIRAVKNKFSCIENIYGKALALDTLFDSFKNKLTKSDSEKTDEELLQYIVFHNKEYQLQIMDNLFCGMQSKILKRKQNLLKNVLDQTGNKEKKMIGIGESYKTLIGRKLSETIGGKSRRKNRRKKTKSRRNIF